MFRTKIILSRLMHHYTVVEIIEAYELSYGQWGILAFACALVHNIGTTVDNFVSRLTENFIHTVCKPKRNVGMPMLSFTK